MYYAPVMIPTLNRYQHLIKCIDSLKKNKYAQYTDLYIALDYPPSEKYMEGYLKIKDFLNKGIEGFNNVIVKERKENFGAAKNLVNMLEEILEEYDRIIVSEDDNVFSPCFLEFVDNGLEYYNDNDDVIALCGYSHNINWTGDEPTVACNTFFSAWGFGITKKKYFEIKEKATMYSFRQYVKNDGIINKIINMAPRNMEYFYRLLFNRGIVFVDIALSVYMMAENKYCVMPRQSLVKNIGWDGSGLHCDTVEAEVYNSQIISSENNFPIEKFNNIHVNEKDYALINAIYSTHEKQFKDSIFKLKIIKFIGVDLYFNLYEKLRYVYRKVKYKE